MHNAFKYMGTLKGLTFLTNINKVYFLAPTTIKDHFLDFFRQLFIGCFNIKIIRFCQRINHMKIICIVLIPATHRTAR